MLPAGSRSTATPEAVLAGTPGAESMAPAAASCSNTSRTSAHSSGRIRYQFNEAGSLRQWGTPRPWAGHDGPHLAVGATGAHPHRYNSVHDVTRGPSYAQCPEPVHGHPAGPATGLPDARYDAVELPSTGLPAHRGDRVRQVPLLRGRVHPAALAGRRLGADPVGAIGLFLDQLRAEREVDAPLDGRPLVIAQVDRSGQLDEGRIEALGGLVLADAILDVPERRIDLLERGDLCRQ